MRIVYLHQYFITPDMSGGTRSYEMARRLVSMGHEVIMITSDQRLSGQAAIWRESVESGVRVYWTPVSYDNRMSYQRRLWAFFTFAWRAARKAAELHGDVVFATSTPLTIALPAVYAAWRAGCPMVFEVRDLWPAVPIAIGAIHNPIAKAAARWLEKFAYRNASHVVALAPGMRDAIIATGYPADQVTVIPNGCDLDLFSGASPKPSPRATTEWLQDRPLVIFTGTFGLVNGMEYIVHLASAVAEIDTEIRIVAVGTGRQFEATKDLARDLGVLDRTFFLLGQLPKVEVVPWVNAADMAIALFTGPKIVWRDAVQNKFFDYLAAGKPVASNFEGWQAKIAKDAGAGLILSPTDYKEAAENIVKSLRNPVWLSQASAAARSLAERFNRDLLAKDLDRVLNQTKTNWS